ncbi:Actin-like protein arp9 [Exophiala xenobiotica]|nr:Actin-like protein arp9 [Exophiala xenobiotica]
MPPFKDEHVLIIAPGSQITAAQLGLPESFTPPRYRFPTRMFPGAKPGEWEPVRIRSKITTTRKEPPPQSQLGQNGEGNVEQPVTHQRNGVQPTSEQPNALPATTDQAQVAQPTGDAANAQISVAEQAPPTDQGQNEVASSIEQSKADQSTTAPAPSGDVDMKEAPTVQEATEAVKPDTDMKDGSKQEETKQEPSFAQETITATKPEPDTEMKDAAQQEAPEEAEEETTESFEDDPWNTEGAVYPLQEGRIDNWPCFFALLSHIYNMISPPFHMPVLFVSQPCWSARDNELITQYVFENWKIPAFCLMDAALTGIYAYGIPTALVVDVGYEKCDVTAVTDYQVNEIGRGAGLSGCGGRTMTKRLQQVLEKQGFNEDMAEQLKKSPICEILPAGTAYPRAGPKLAAPDAAHNPAAAASTGALDSGVNAKDVDGLRPGQAPRGPGMGTMVGDDTTNGEDDDNDGVLDVAAIVARDNAAELLAKREKEKAEKAAAAKKGAVAEAQRQLRLRNSEKERAHFTYTEFLPVEETSDGEPTSRKRKREIEVGVERFMAATPLTGSAEGLIDTVAEAMHHAVLSVPEVGLRSTLWENLIVLGNGSRIRGFAPSLISALNSKYVLSPSTATIFTSELPSNFTTPVATPGTNTPIPGQGGQQLHHPGGGVNPLLVAATKNMMQPNQQHLQVPGQGLGQAGGQDLAMGMQFHHSRGFSQSPTSIKTVKAPDYFPEWKDPSVSGMEEAAFLGAQVAAKVVFIVDQGNSKGFLTRTEYNELGPGGIHECAL